jgi:protein Tex
VDLNTASWALLRYVAGITERTAQKIVEYRNEHGRFRSRVQLKAVTGFGPKTFEQAAGFLRIRGGENPLDMTAVHPEAYAVVEKIAASLQVSVPELVARPDLIEKVKLEGFATQDVGMYTLTDIREELRKPGRDPREKFVAAKWRDDVTSIADLKPGMTLEGVVTNVTRFGAFIDVGVHQDGLVHVSELANRFVKDASDVVKVGQIVKVQVLSADPKAKRIALSMKALDAAPPPPKLRHTAKPEAQKPTLEDQLSGLSNKFRVR